MSADERISALEARVTRLNDETVALRLAVSWLVGSLAAQANVPKKQLTEWFVDAIQNGTLAVNANRDQMQRIQSYVVSLLDSALP
jgi:hypothetical protein